MPSMASLLLTASLIGSSLSQYFPPTPEGVVVLDSKYHEGVKISYKEPGICETTPGVKSYSGYVHLPPGLLSDIAGEKQDYPVNTFFWFFESRKDPHNAPLSIWLNGGPGSSSMMGLLQENGPCLVNSDSNSTYLNPWSWNNEVNMLFLDQPTHVGFSYDVPTNGTRILEGSELLNSIVVGNFTDRVPEQNATHLIGTFSSQNASTTANTTLHAAHAIWHFAQTFFFEFPAYKPKDDRVSLWCESFGGHYGPAFFNFFRQQNGRIANGTISEPGTQYIHLDTLGIINGLVDQVVQAPGWLHMAYNNTYGIQAINKTQYDELMHTLYEGGCLKLLAGCVEAIKKHDTGNGGNLDDLRESCKFDGSCHMLDPETWYADFSDKVGHGMYDIAHPFADPFPPPYLAGFLSQHWVQKALGVPVNYTASSATVARAFQDKYDILHAGYIEEISELLDSGIKVALVYGDRDFLCNWIGGEAVSLAINYTGTEKFHEAGYSPILVPGVGISGQVRQYGNLSFSRVYQAGHEVPAYQPETAYSIFMRSMFNRDVATGLIPLTDDYSTVGPSSTWHIKNAIPSFPQSRCYVLTPESCTPEQWETVMSGTAIVKDYFVIGLRDSVQVDLESEVRLREEVEAVLANHRDDL